MHQLLEERDCSGELPLEPDRAGQGRLPLLSPEGREGLVLGKAEAEGRGEGPERGRLPQKIPLKEPAIFLVQDTLHLDQIGRTFDTVIDSGFFHTLSDPDRPRFVRNLSVVLKPGGTYFMLAFSDLEPAGYGPRRIAKREIMDAFSDGWRINWIRAAVFESHPRTEGSHAWLSSIIKV